MPRRWTVYFKQDRKVEYMNDENSNYKIGSGEMADGVRRGVWGLGGVGEGGVADFGTNLISEIGTAK